LVIKELGEQFGEGCGSFDIADMAGVGGHGECGVGEPGAEFAEHIGRIPVVGSGEQQDGKLQFVDGGAEVIVL